MDCTVTNVNLNCVPGPGTYRTVEIYTYITFFIRQVDDVAEEEVKQKVAV